MASIKLVRIDSRLIHGQVITKWLKISGANRVIIVDDELANDDFMSIIYTTAAPKDVGVEIKSVDKAYEEWCKDQFGEGSLLILFKDIDSCHRLQQLGFTFNEIQIGGLPSAPAKVVILRAVSLDDNDVTQLKEMQQNGTEINIHIIPEEPSMDFQSIIRKFDKKK